MSDKSAFEKREASFEAEYFNKKNAELTDKLRALFRKKVTKEEITAKTGVTDETILDRMVELNLNGELMSAFQLYPVIEVAWADGKLDQAERDSILTAAAARGITKGSRAYDYLNDRLQKGPSEDVRKVWFGYAERLREVLSKEELDTFRTDIFHFCQSVAQASGGILGNYFTVSRSEQKVLDAIEKALTN